MKKAIVVAVFSATFAAPFFVVAAGPYLLLNTYSATPGNILQISGYQFSPSTNVLVSVAGTSTGALVTNGTFSASLTIPNVASGNYTVFATSPQRVQATTSLYISNRTFFPRVSPSKWYVRPGEDLTFTGTGFAPNSPYQITGGSGTLSGTTDANGAFSKTITVPYLWQNSSERFTVTSGNTSSVPLTITIGSFYPNMFPSSYYVAHGSTMNADVTGFAPGEPVMLLVNGALVAQHSADSSGQTTFTLTTPLSGTAFSLVTEGAYSHVLVTRTITLH